MYAGTYVKVGNVLLLESHCNGCVNFEFNKYKFTQKSFRAKMVCQPIILLSKFYDVIVNKAIYYTIGH